MDSSEEDDIIIIALLLRRRRRRKIRLRNPRRWWVHPINQIRVSQGAYHNLIMEMRKDPEKFYNFHRLTVNQFDVLLRRIEARICRIYYRRDPVPPGLRLSLSLRYIASGDSMVSLSYLYRLGKSTVSKIIREVTEAIWETLKPDVLPTPTASDFIRISYDFEELWNFPNCISAIDGKHILCQCLTNTGSTHFNYEGSFSLALLAACDAHYRFTFVDIGAAGRESDGGIFQRSTLCEALERNILKLPPPRSPIGSNIIVPPVILGDAAFPLKEYMLRPYLGENLPHEEVIFNYRHSRARRVIENAFGVLASRMRIFRKPIIADVDLIRSVVQSAVVLHNWLCDEELNVPAGQRRYMPVEFVDREDRNGLLHEGAWREETDTIGLQPIPTSTACNYTKSAKNIRKTFTNYFMHEGHVPWQWAKLPAHVGEVLQQKAERPREP